MHVRVGMRCRNSSGKHVLFTETPVGSRTKASVGQTLAIAHAAQRMVTVIVIGYDCTQRTINAFVSFDNPKNTIDGTHLRHARATKTRR